MRGEHVADLGPRGRKESCRTRSLASRACLRLVGPSGRTPAAKSNGWTAGAGIEYAITDTILGRIENRYTDLHASGFVNIPANLADGGTRTPINDFRVGFAYKFGGAL